MADGVFDPFGNAQFTSGGGVWDTSQWDHFLWGASLTLTNLRFPGQHADAETGLNQNWFRDYDPTIGRYIQSDPVGLLAGLNTYSYAEGNPISYGDPAGLALETGPGAPAPPPLSPSLTTPSSPCNNEGSTQEAALLNNPSIRSFMKACIFAACAYFHKTPPEPPPPPPPVPIVAPYEPPKKE